MSLTFALQALLARHEEYMAEAEEERRKMAMNVEKLELDKRQLQDTNRIQIEENVKLKKELETLGKIASESDRHVANLNSTLETTHQELRKLSSFAIRATDLERQLIANESERGNLQYQLTVCENDGQSAIQRCTNAERTIERLQDQLDRIDVEARDERERHVDMVARLEKRRTVEEDMEGTVLRSRGAATVGRVKRGSGIVPNFVKDIMQDNANLQVGITELREMLRNSNLEIENLRQQTLLHPSPVTDNLVGIKTSDLMSEMTKKAPMEALPEVHVHHHYHIPQKVVDTARGMSTDHRQPRRKPDNALSGSMPNSSTQTPCASSARTPRPSSSAAVAMSQTSTMCPPCQGQSVYRRSINSLPSRIQFSPSTVASSPPPSATFDYTANTSDVSRPDTPDTFDAGHSPRGHLVKQGNGENSAAYTSGSTDRGSSVLVDTPCDFDIGRGYNHESTTKAESTERSLLEHSAINTYSNEADNTMLDFDLSVDPEYFGSSIQQYPETIHHYASHESLLSNCANPTRPLRKRPSHIITAQGLNPAQPSEISFPTTSLVTGKPVVSAALITSRPSWPITDNNDGSIQRSLLSSGSNTGTIRSVEGHTTGNPTLGKRISGWVWGLREDNLRNLRGGSRIETDSGTVRGSIKMSGSVKGIQPPAVESIRVDPVGIDESLLEESLGEG